MMQETSTTRVALAGALAMAMAMGVGRFAYTPILPMMQSDGLITVSEGGWLASAHFLGYLMGAIAAARLTWPPRRVLRVALWAVAVTTLLMGLIAEPVVWIGLRWAAGLFSAWVLVHVGNYHVRHLAAQGRAETQGWVFAGVGAGIAAVGLGVLAMTVAGIGSATAWQVFGLVSVLIAAGLGWQMGPELPASRPRAQMSAAVHAPFDWTVISAYAAAGLGYVVPATYLPVMAREAVSSPWVFGWVWPAFGLAAVVSILLSARFASRLPNRVLWSANQCVMAAGLVLPAAYPSIVTVAVAGLCVGGTFMVITMAGIREAHAIAAPDAAVTHVAAMTAAFALGQMVGPAFAGALYDLTDGFSAALWGTGLVLGATALVLVLHPTRAAAERT